MKIFFEDFDISSMLENKSKFLSICSISILSFIKIFLNVSLNLLNSRSLKILDISLLFGVFNFKSSILYLMGTSVIIVANFLDKIPKSLFFSIFSFNLPFICSVF